MTGLGDWGSDRVPSDEWLIQQSRPKLVEWLTARATGADERWSPRSDEAPLELIRVLLVGGSSEDAKHHLIEALQAALRRQLALSRTEATPSSIPLVELAGECGSFLSVLAQDLAAAVDEALFAVSADSPIELVEQLLRARARFKKPANPKLWQRHLDNPRLAVAAFQCALNSAPSLRKQAFFRMIPATLQNDVPAWPAQALIVLDRIGHEEFERWVAELGASGGGLAAVATELALALDMDLPAAIGTSNARADIAAFSLYTGATK